jgi:anti-anti-sigma factor
MKVATSQYGNYILVSLQGEIDYYNLAKVKQSIKSSIEEHRENIIIDLHGVTYMDSSGIGFLVTAHKLMEKDNRTMTLANVPEDVMQLLRLGTVESFLTIVPSLDDIPV